MQVEKSPPRPPANRLDGIPFQIGASKNFRNVTDNSPRFTGSKPLPDAQHYFFSDPVPTGSATILSTARFGILQSGDTERKHHGHDSQATRFDLKPLMLTSRREAPASA